MIYTADGKWQAYEEPAGTLLGDADSDGAVTVLDATAIQRNLASFETAAFDEKAADVDGDGIISILDATYIQRWLAGYADGYRINEKIA